MSDEFSLLNHLDINVEESAFLDRAPRSHLKRQQYRVWSPLTKPPFNFEIGEIQTKCKIRSTGEGVVEPTNEVIRFMEGGGEVECVIYQSKIPSIYGVNKQHAEDNRSGQRVVDPEENVPTHVFVKKINADERAKAVARKKLLDELRHYNVRQMECKRDELRRETQRRVMKEALALQHFQDEGRQCKQREQKKRSAMELSEWNNTEGSAEMKNRDELLRFSEETLLFSNRDEEYIARAAQIAKERQLMEENKRLAEEAKVRRLRERQDEITEARMVNKIAEDGFKENERRRREEKERMRAALKDMSESTAERRRHGKVEFCTQVSAGGSGILDFADRSEGHLLAVQQEKLKATQEINRQLAEERRQRLSTERRRERQLEQELLQKEYLVVAKEREKEQARKLQQQIELRTAAEKAMRQKAERAAKERHVDPVPCFFQSKVKCNEYSKEARLNFFEEIRLQAERKKRECFMMKEKEREMEKSLLERAQRAAEHAESRRKEKKALKQAELLSSLKSQIAQKKEAARAQRPARFVATPSLEQRALYRCPVTNALFPSSAFDFGAQHH